MWKYKHDGRFIVGIPARDLTEKEFDALTKADQEAVRASGAWEYVETDKAAKPAKEKSK